MSKAKHSVLSFILSAAFVFSAAAPASAFEIRTEAPENSEDAPEQIFYYSTENPYNTFGCEMPNCTAYAWGRIFEILGEKPMLSWNMAGRWYGENIASGAYSYGCEPRNGAVICYDKFDEIHGHVAVSESVSEDGCTVTVTESQYGGELFKTYEQMADASWSRNGYRLLGYIYPDETDAKFYGDGFRISDYNGVSYLTRTENTSVLSERNENTVSQNFRFEPLDNGNYRIWSCSTGLALTNTDDGVFFLENENSEASEWKILTEINSLWTVCTAEDTNKVLTFSENGAEVAEYTASENQFWNIERFTGTADLNTEERNIVFSLDCTQTRTEYYTEEFLDLSGIRFFLNGNEVSNIDISKLSADYDFTVPGTQTVTVTYGYSSISFDVTVTEPEEGEEVVRNNEIRRDIINFIFSEDDTPYSELLDVNGDGVINVADILLS